MPETTVGLDLDLCRKILVRLEETLVNFIPNGPARYEFDGYSPQMIDYNTKKLHEADLVGVRNRSNSDREVPKYWPAHFHEKGIRVVTAIRDEADWEKAIEAMNAQTDKPTLKTLKIVLLDVVQKEAV